MGTIVKRIKGLESKSSIQKYVFVLNNVIFEVYLYIAVEKIK